MEIFHLKIRKKDFNGIKDLIRGRIILIIRVLRSKKKKG